MLVTLAMAMNIYGEMNYYSEQMQDLLTCQVRAVEMMKQIQLDHPEAVEIGIGCIIDRGEPT